MAITKPISGRHSPRRNQKISLTIPMVSGFCRFMIHTLLVILVPWFIVYLVTMYCASGLLNMKQCEVCKEGHAGEGNEECDAACGHISNDGTCIHDEGKEDIDMFFIHILIIEEKPDYRAFLFLCNYRFAIMHRMSIIICAYLVLNEIGFFQGYCSVVHILNLFLNIGHIFWSVERVKCKIKWYPLFSSHNVLCNTFTLLLLFFVYMRWIGFLCIVEGRGSIICISCRFFQ